MRTAFELLSRNAADPTVTVLFDGKEYILREGENLAAELLRIGVSVLRQTPVSGAPRGPFCMMGACYDCLIEHEGEKKQACQMNVFDGLEVSTIGYRDDDEGKSIA